MEEKKEIRKQIFARRKAHTDEQIEAMSKEVTRKVLELALFSGSGPDLCLRGLQS